MCIRDRIEVFVSQNNPDGETDKNSMRAVPLEELPEEIQEHIKAIIRHEQRKVCLLYTSLEDLRNSVTAESSLSIDVLVTGRCLCLDHS